MTQYPKQDNSLNIQGSNCLLHAPLRIAVEEAVSAYIQHDWRIRIAKDMSDRAAVPPCVSGTGQYWTLFARHGHSLKNCPIGIIGPIASNYKLNHLQ